MTKMLVLASQSPRRAELLQQLGLKFDTLKIDCDESRLDGESPANYVLRVAKEKAECARAVLNGESADYVVLASDTTVALENEIFGKPRDRSHARQIWRTLGGCWHDVLTGVAVATPEECHFTVQSSRVLFRELTEDESNWYWNTGEPQDKAGAYAIQGLGSIFIESISGSYSGIMGLPLFETVSLLKKFGIVVTQNLPFPPEG